MVARHRPVVSTIAFQFTAQLEDYEADFERCLACEMSLSDYAKLSARMDELRARCGAFPSMSSDMVELMLCHTQLMYDKWQLVPLEPDAREDLSRRHSHVVERLLTKARRLFRSRA
jgi:hypothetical protein